MIKVKKFSGTNYIQVRSEIHKWLEDNPDKKILDVTESHGTPEQPTRNIRVFRIIYEKG